MDRYLRYGLILFATWIIASRLISLMFVLYKNYPDAVTGFGYWHTVLSGVSMIAGLLAGVTGVVLIVESARKDWDITRIAMSFLGFVLILSGAYSVFINKIIAVLSVSMDNGTVFIWARNVFGTLHVICAVLIVVSLSEEGAVARKGLFVYSIVTITGVATKFFGMEGNPGAGTALALISIVAAVFIFMRQ